MSEKTRECNIVLYIAALIFFFQTGCKSDPGLLVAYPEMHGGFSTSRFDSTIEVSEISEAVLKKAAHLYINADDGQLDFYERNAIERYLEAGGAVTFSCRDTIYNWGQLQPYLTKGLVRIDCDSTGLLISSSPDYSDVKTPRKPTMDRMIREVLAQPLREPMALAVTENSLVYWIERKGAINLHDPATGKSGEIDHLEVYTGEEDGLLGIVLDPNYAENRWAYIFYSPAGDEPKQHVSRFTLTRSGLDRSSEKVLLEVPTQRDECCHSAGDLEFGRDGNLYISTGDNTFSRASDGFTPIDERPGRSAFDAQRSSANTHDLRGKILRIHPNPDGTYCIPDGNLFPKDGSEGLPEIYVMGARNPFRIALNRNRRWLYWGDVGPDGNVTSERGPSAHDEVNFALAPGYFGWPYFNADNKAYADYDFATGEIGEKFDPMRPVNTSVSNTGNVVLPPAQPAMIYYTFDETPLFPGVGKGSRSVGAGDVYQYEEAEHFGYEFSPYYDDKLFIFDWARSWVKVVTQNKEGKFLSIEPFLDNRTVAAPIDMAFGPDGALYVLEYGFGYFSNNRDSRLSRFDFVYGNRPPAAKLNISTDNGAVPLLVSLSAAESTDPDRGDALTYEWQIAGPEVHTLAGKEAEVTLNSSGEYEVRLVVSDHEGAKSTAEVSVIAGNTKPQIDFEFALNKSFYWPGDPIKYALKVTDIEDGVLGGGIPESAVSVNLFKYVGSENRAVASLEVLNEGVENLAPGLQIIQGSDCRSCHKINESSIGPSFMQIANRYDQDYIAKDVLAKKIIKGGTGVWGDGMMIAHPDLSMDAAREIVDYIFSVNDQKKEAIMLGTSGKISTQKGDKSKYRFEAAYEDAGGRNTKSLSAKVEKTLVPPVLQAEAADSFYHFAKRGAVEDGDKRFLNSEGEKPYLVFEDVDITNIDRLTLAFRYFRMADSENQVTVEVRMDGAEGKIIGKSIVEKGKSEPEEVDVELEKAAGVTFLCIAFTSENGQFRLGLDEVRFHKKAEAKSMLSIK